jgi:hypothetical protein
MDARTAGTGLTASSMAAASTEAATAKNEKANGPTDRRCVGSTNENFIIMDDTINEVIKQKQSLFKLQPTETTKAKVPKIINFSNRKIEDNCFKRAIERLYGNAEDALF